MPKYREVLQINEQYALDNNKEDSGIKILLLHFSKMDAAQLLLHLEDDMPEDTYQEFLYAVDRYITKNIPVQHITGYEYFFGYQFKVNSDVLIPRFETEELVAQVLMMYDDVFDGQPVDVVDIGTGSGCLAVTLSKEEPLMNVTATDISKAALNVAQENNDTIGSRVTFIEGDMLKPLEGMKFDILVSNPPYIPNDEFVEELVKGHEPHLALFGGIDGLDFYRQILEGAQAILKDRFIIAFEHAYDKAKDIKKVVKKNFKDVDVIQKKDMQGKDRMTFVVKK